MDLPFLVAFGRKKILIMENIFENKTVQVAQLETFGFKKQGNTYVYFETVLNGVFQIKIEIIPNELPIVSVIDTQTEELYLPIFSEVMQGSFVQQVRSECNRVLERILEECYEKKSSQTERLIQKIREMYDDSLVHPFKRYPAYRVLCHSLSQKWYALFCAIQYKQLGVFSNQEPLFNPEDEIAIVNVKVTPDTLKLLQQKRGYYPAYHMNKKHWVSIVLEEIREDDEIFQLIKASRELVS